MTPKKWYQETIGKAIDTDNYPRSNPYQCWDYFDYFCRVIGFKGSRYCGSTGYVGDLWLLRDSEGYNYSTTFEYITNTADLKTGDWVFWAKHVAMYYDGMEVGQNQPAPYVTIKSMNWDGVLGAMRWKKWENIGVGYGKTTFKVGDRSYSMWRMSGSDRIGVLSPGLNKVATLKQQDADVLVEAKITGANYFQMKHDQPDPYGTTYGDISSTLNGVYQSLPNQDTTLFYDLETGDFGDCSDVNINSSHNVFSPSLVFPNSKGHWEYARMVGLDHKDYKSRYTFLVKFLDGYAVGVAEQDCTPQEIADDFSQTEMINIAFLDGGGSAQAAFWYDGSMHYEVDNNRACASALAIYRMPEDPVAVPDVPEEVPEEEPDVPDVPDEPQDEPHDEPQDEPEIPEEEEDEPVNEEKKTIYGQIAALIDVKSIMTIMLVFTLCYLVLSGKELDDKFMTIVTAVVTFYFSYQVKKNGGGS